MKKKEPMPRLSLRCDEETAALVNRIAVARKATTSEILRDLVQAGMEKQQGEETADQLQRLQEITKEVIKPYMERLAAINAKSAHIAAATFFLETYVCRLYLPEGDHRLIEDAAVSARQLGSECLNLNGSELDTFIRNFIGSER